MSNNVKKVAEHESLTSPKTERNNFERNLFSFYMLNVVANNRLTDRIVYNLLFLRNTNWEKEYPTGIVEIS